MVKQLVSSSDKTTVQVQDTNQGCMWNLLHILDYHHWHVKKVFTHKKRRHARYKNKAISHNQDEEDQQYGVAEAESLLVMQNSRNSRATDKSSPKNCRKGPVTESWLQQENSEGRIHSLPGESHHSEYAHHLEKDGNTTKVSLNRKHMETRTNKLSKDITNKFKKQNDVLEVFGVEKDLLLKFLREFDFGGKNLHQASHSKARLTKSGSFPLASSSHMKSISPSTLKHKQNEVWAFPKGEKLLGGTKATKMSASSVVKDISYEKPITLASDLGDDGAMKQKSGISSRPFHGLNQKGWNQLVLHRFKVIKQKIKHVLVETIHHRASPEYSITSNEKEVSQSLDDGVIEEHLKNKSPNETKFSVSASKRHELRLVRRTSSLNESLDKYTELFEKSFSTDVKWHSSKSKSLRLTNEDKKNKSGHVPKFSRSNFSLPNMEALGFILHEALLDMNDTIDLEETGNHVQAESVSLPLQKDESFGHAEETEIEETVEAGGRDVNPSPLSGKVVEKFDEIVTTEQKEDIHEPVVDESFPQEKEERNMTISPSNTTNNEEGRELSKQGSSVDESKTEFPNVVATAEDLTINKSPEIHSLLLKPNTDNDSIFKYVKAILDISGFMGTDHTQVLHPTHQPLKPSLLKVLDKSLRHEIESSHEESIKIYDNHHQLLFNLVNEVLLEIQERSPSYFPKPFSFNYRLHPMPKGNHLINEVWYSVNSYLRLRPELDQTLDDVVGRDLAKRSGWMNLQEEEEYVALELEEMIMEDLIDEITF